MKISPTLGISLLLVPLLVFYSWTSVRNYVKYVNLGEQTAVEKEVDGAKHFTISYGSHAPNTLILILTKDSNSWGREKGHMRTLSDMLQMVKPNPDTSFGILTSSMEEYNSHVAILKKAHYGRATVIYHPGYEQGVYERHERKADDVQKERRRLLSRLRNYLMLSVIQKEEHVFWLDADVYEISSGIFEKTLSHVKSGYKGEKVGIVTARCSHGDNNPDYDANAWQGPRIKPNATELETVRKGGLFVPRPTPDTKFMKELTDKSSSDELVKLDSVGGTFLYIRGDLVRQGVVFSLMYIIGTEWEIPEGWDGIETEGICYVSKVLGYGCYGLGGSWEVKHTWE